MAFLLTPNSNKVFRWDNVSSKTCQATNDPLIGFNKNLVNYDTTTQKLTGTVEFEYNEEQSTSLNGVIFENIFPSAPVSYTKINFNNFNFTVTNFQGNTSLFNANFDIIFDTCCFSEGTKILSLYNQQPINGCITAQLKEEYRLVQDLMIGDFVKTYLHGYRKVSKVISGSFVNNPNDEGVSNCMYRMLKTEDNGLIKDLTLTRNHGVLVEKLTENEEEKVNKNNLPVIDNLLSIITADSDKFEKVMDTNVYKYYHFSLDGDGDEDRRFGVYANGILVEVPSNNMMDNALNVKPLDF